MFNDYFGYPYSTSKHVSMIQLYVDFENRRAIIPGDGDYEFSLTTIHDISTTVAEALDYPGTWPTVCGIQETKITITELLHLGERLTG